MAVMWIRGSNEVLVSEALASFIDSFTGRAVYRVDSPKSAEALENPFSNFSLTEKVGIIYGLSKIKRWKKFIPFLKDRNFEVAVVTPKDVWELKDAFYSKLKKISKIVECPGVKPFGTDPAKYILERGKKNGVAIDPMLVWVLYSCTGPDALRIEQEVKKLALYGDSAKCDGEAMSVLFRHRIGDINFEALLGGDFHNFVQSCDGIDPVDLFWRLINKFFRYIEYKTFIETQGTIRGKVSRARERMIKDICKRRTAENFNAAVSSLVRVLTPVRDLKIESLIYGALYDWSKA